MMRRSALQHLKTKYSDIKNYDIYEFGVYIGTSMLKIQRFLGTFPCNNVYCFDSFEGLPEEEENIPKYHSWFKGNYNIQEKLGLTSVEAGIKVLQQKIKFSSIPVHFIPGYFETVLCDKFIQQYHPKKAIYIDIDVDLYVSAKECLEFMFKYNLVEAGTLIGYDDWGGTEEFKGGESLAHKEMCEKYGIVCTELFSFGKMPHVQKVFEVKGIE